MVMQISLHSKYTKYTTGHSNYFLLLNGSNVSLIPAAVTLTAITVLSRGKGKFLLCQTLFLLPCLLN